MNSRLLLLGLDTVAIKRIQTYINRFLFLLGKVVYLVRNISLWVWALHPYDCAGADSDGVAIKPVCNFLCSLLISSVAPIAAGF